MWLHEAHLSATDAGNEHALLSQEDDQEVNFLLQVPTDLAHTVISSRWRHSIEEILQDVIGYPVKLAITYDPEEEQFGQELGFGELRDAREAARETADLDIFPTSGQKGSYAYFNLPSKKPVQTE